MEEGKLQVVLSPQHLWVAFGEFNEGIVSKWSMWLLRGQMRISALHSRDTLPSVRDKNRKTRPWWMYSVKLYPSLLTSGQLDKLLQQLLALPHTSQLCCQRGCGRGVVSLKQLSFPRQYTGNGGRGVCRMKSTKNNTRVNILVGATTGRRPAQRRMAPAGGPSQEHFLLFFWKPLTLVFVTTLVL